MHVVRFLLPTTIGLSFFLLPVPAGGRWTVPFDLCVQWLVRSLPGPVSLYCLIIIISGAALSLVACRKVHRASSVLDRYRTSSFILAARLLGVPLALIYVTGLGPEVLLQPGVRDLMWSTLASSVGVIVPMGAALLMLFVDYGFLELVGTLTRPVMRPLFRLPGRAALDSLTSWIGSYSVGLYLTRKLFDEGYYSRREAFTIVTCFSTVSIGFVAVVAQTLGILNLFPILFVSYFVLVYLLTSILSRIWPIVSVPDTFPGEARPEETASGSLLRSAWSRASARAESAPPFLPSLAHGFADGLILASTILGSILTVGTLALLIARETPLFQWLGAPLVPVLTFLGLPDGELIAPASIAGISEMYIPALLSREAAVPARFFVALLSISQLIFFSSVAPMMLDMFGRIPIRARDLLVLFFMRTILLIPIIAALTNFLESMGVL